MDFRKTRQLLAIPFAAGMLMSTNVAIASELHEPAEVNLTSSPSENTVTGTVTDETGEPLIGVTVRLAGHTEALAVTDVNGNFAVNAPSGATLTFSYIGYKTQDVPVNGQSTVDVQLVPDSKALDEVVVIGYGTVRKADLAGSVSVLEGKAFAAQPITQVSEALQGRVSGVNVISDGLPGGSVKIRVRGSNSINKSNEPLYVVDGLVRESGLEGINPDDIASMQILKDASSTAIYGSRGANGVVIITTKKGKAGESRLTFGMSFGFANATRLPKLMGTKEYAKALIEYDGITEMEVKPYLDGSKPGIDWEDEVFRTGVIQDYKLVLSKGNEDLQFYLSANYMNNKGIIESSKYERYAARATMNAKVFSWLDVTTEINASHGIGKGIGGLDLGAYNPLWIAFNSSPTMEMKNENGVYNKDPYCTIQNNAMGVLNSPNERRRDVFNGHVDFRFNILPGLTFTSSNGVDYNEMYNYNQTLTSQAPSTVSAMSNNNTNRWLLQTSNNLTYINTFAEKHNLTATAVWEATKSTTRTMGISGKNLNSELVGWWNVKDAKERDASNSYSSWSLLSAIARVIYSYDNRYMLTGTFRADGSSRLTHKWSYFPSIAAAWTISRESFMENLNPVINNLKLRTSFGIIGNQDIDPYTTLALMGQTTTYYGSTNPVTGYWANKVASPDLKWEKTKQVDVGVDASFLNGRIDVSLDWYYKRTSDALLRTNRPDYLGGSEYMINAGEVSNTGVDISINANVIQGGDWNWSTSVNASVMRNRVEKMTTSEPILYSGSMQSVIYDACIVKTGESIGSLYGYRWAGIDNDGYDTYYTASGEITRSPASGDRVVLGKSTPDFTLGWNNTVTYKNWSLNAFFNGSFGAKRLNALRYAMNSKIGNSRMFTAADYISQIGTTMPNPNVPNNTYIGESSKWVEKADYFRLENITLGYDLRKDVTRFADIHLSFSIQNLFTITGYKGCNPASYTFGTSDWQQGVDTGTSPAPRTYTVGATFSSKSQLKTDTT